MGQSVSRTCIVPIGLTLSLAVLSPLVPRAAAADALEANDAPRLALRQHTTPTAPGPSQAYGRLPLSFEPNQGQAAAEVRFLARGPGYTVLLGSDQAELLLRAPASSAGPSDHSAQPSTATIRMRLVGADAGARIEGTHELPGRVSYFVGQDPVRWRRDIPTYAKVRYRDVWSGIDMVYYGNPGQLEYDFVVAPGADPQAIRLVFDGAERIRTDEQGDLVLDVVGGQLRMHRPVVYQEVGGARREVAGAYVLEAGSRVTFKLGNYDAGSPLVIDPALSYATYLGGFGFQLGTRVAVDAAGHMYVAGVMLPFGGGGPDIFVAKVDPSGSLLLYTAILGGSGAEFALGLAVGADGSAYVAGKTDSVNIPTTPGVVQPFYGGGASDAFVAQLDPSGSALTYASYLGGTGADWANGLSVDSTGRATLAGATASPDFPIMLPLQGSLAGGFDAFVATLSPGGSSLVYSTYFGGSFDDRAYGIALGSDGSAYVTGETQSFNFPVSPTAFQPGFGGFLDAFVTKLAPDGQSLAYSTYLGGSFEDAGTAIAVNAAGEAHVTGWASSFDFPLVNPAQPVIGLVVPDAFVAKLNTAGSALLYSTYLGGSDEERGTGIAVDEGGRAHVVGFTLSPNFPMVDPVQPALAGLSDAFVTTLATSGTFEFSTYLGGTGYDSLFPFFPGHNFGPDVAAHALGIHVAGSGSPGFPTTPNALQPFFDGGDAFLVRIAPSATTANGLAISMTDTPDPLAVGTVLLYTVTITNTVTEPRPAGFFTAMLPGSLQFLAALSTRGDCGPSQAGVECSGSGLLDPGESITIRIFVVPTFPGRIAVTAHVQMPFPNPPAVVGVTTEVTAFNGNLDLQAFKFAPSTALPGSSLTYGLGVLNTGPDTALNVTVFDLLPPGVTYVGATGASCTEYAGLVSCQLGDLPPFAQPPPLIQIEVIPETAGVLTNTVVVRSDTGESDTSNNVRTTTTLITSDTTPPIITPSVTGVLGTNNWYVSNITVSWIVTDPQSPITSSSGCGTTVINFDTPGFGLQCTATSAGGTASAFVTGKRDATKPTAMATASPGPNGNGWNNTDVVVTFSGTDNLSGIAGCSAPVTLTGEGANLPASGTCTDHAGNVSAPAGVTVNIDRTPPALACSVSPTSMWPPNHVLVSVTATVSLSDTLSGPGGFVLAAVTSSEPDTGTGPGDLPGDIQGFTVATPDISGQLRAERADTGLGRVYRLTYSGMDTAGNVAQCQASITVPHNQGN